jgi:hypothetical protein
MSNKSLASDLTCYFFDEEGRFLGGQILIPAYREMDIRTITLAGPDRVAITVDRGDILYFTLQNHALVLESLVTQNGRKFDAVKTKNCNGWGILSSATKFIATPTSVRMLPPPVGGK